MFILRHPVSERVSAAGEFFQFYGRVGSFASEASFPLIKIAQCDNYYHQRGKRQALLITVSDFNHFTGRQVAAARALLGLGQVELAARANVSAATLRRVESSDGIPSGMVNNLAAIRTALEAVGVEFIKDGVRLRTK